jgi:predicted RND superfamily exporter protein
LVSFLALLMSDSSLIRTFGTAGALATLVSYVAVLAVLPILALALIRNEEALARAPVDTAMDSLGALVGWIVDRVVRRPWTYTIIGFVLFGLFAAAHLSLQPRYRLADQVPDREQALAATGKLDKKLTGANPVHVMIQWNGGHDLFDQSTLDVIRQAQTVLEKQAGLGNVWSLDSLRRWLAETGDTSVETVKHYVGLLPEHLTRRFISEDQHAALVTARLPDIDASQILPKVDTIDRALEPVRKANPDYKIWVTGLPAIAARNSASMIQQLNAGLPVEVAFVAILVGLAFRSLFTGVLTLLPALFPIVSAGAVLWAFGTGIEFASVVALVVIFGLGVDGLVHFLNRLRLEEHAGEDPALAIRRARVLVGPAIILTTIVLAFGLGVTAFSSLPSLRLFGAVCAITLMASLIGDLVFLPATIVVWRRLFAKKGP